MSTNKMQLGLNSAVLSGGGHDHNGNLCIPARLFLPLAMAHFNVFETNEGFPTT